MDGDMIGDELTGRVRSAVRAEIGGHFDEMRQMMDRRIAELSAEIHASVQMVGFSEANLSGQLGAMHTQLSHILALPSSATRNSGLELEAVMQATEEAANRILGAAEAIHSLLTERFSDHPASQAIVEQIDSIFEACSFQDLTGQRIRRAIQQLQNIEGSLAQIVQQTTRGDVRAPQPALTLSVDGIAVTGPDLAQNDIDRLLNS
jgi:chemotaxis protein CheZ